MCVCPPLLAQLASARELEAAELQSQLAEHSHASTAQQAADAAALAAQRAALTAASTAEEARLRREIQVCVLCVWKGGVVLSDLLCQTATLGMVELRGQSRKVCCIQYGCSCRAVVGVAAGNMPAFISMVNAACGM